MDQQNMFVNNTQSCVRVVCVCVLWLCMCVLCALKVHVRVFDFGRVCMYVCTYVRMCVCTRVCSKHNTTYVCTCMSMSGLPVPCIGMERRKAWTFRRLSFACFSKGRVLIRENHQMAGVNSKVPTMACSTYITLEFTFF